jgi:hypothetical protein
MDDALSAVLLSYTQLLGLLPADQAYQTTMQHVRSVLASGPAKPAAPPRVPAVVSNVAPVAAFSRLQTEMGRCCSVSVNDQGRGEGLVEGLDAQARPAPNQAGAALLLLAACGHATQTTSVKLPQQLQEPNHPFPSDTQLHVREEAQRVIQQECDNKGSLCLLGTCVSSDAQLLRDLAAQLLLKLVVPSQQLGVDGLVLDPGAVAAVEEDEACQTVRR